MNKNTPNRTLTAGSDLVCRKGIVCFYVASLQPKILIKRFYFNLKIKNTPNRTLTAGSDLVCRKGIVCFYVVSLQPKILIKRFYFNLQIKLSKIFLQIKMDS